MRNGDGLAMMMSTKKSRAQFPAIAKNFCYVCSFRSMENSTGFSWALKVIHWLAEVSDCNSTWVENDTQSARHKQYTQTSHMLTTPHNNLNDYMG